jgi:hypothetical protein
MSEEKEEFIIKPTDKIWWTNSRKVKSGPAEVIEVNGDILRVMLVIDPLQGSKSQTKRFNVHRSKVLNVTAEKP